MKKALLGLTLITAATVSLFAGDSAQVLIEKNKCMSCHNIMGMKDAPPFAGIAHRNSRMGNAKATIENSIQNGSKGKYPMFSDIQMPAFNKLSKEDLNTLSEWVLSQSSKMMQCGSGKCGSGMMKNGTQNMMRCGSGMNNNQ